MTSTSIIIDSAILFLAIIVLVFNLRAFRKSRALVGEVRAHWSTRFNFSYPWEWLRLAFMLGLLAISVTVAIAKPAAGDPFWSLALICLVVAFFPRNNFIVIGSAGLLDRSIFIPWTSVQERRVVEENGRRYLELKVVPAPGGGVAEETRRIRVPGNVSLVLD